MIKYICYVIKLETIGNKNMCPVLGNISQFDLLHTFIPQSFVQRFKIINKKLCLVQKCRDTGLKRYMKDSIIPTQSQTIAVKYILLQICSMILSVLLSFSS